MVFSKAWVNAFKSGDFDTLNAYLNTLKACEDAINNDDLDTLKVLLNNVNQALLVQVLTYASLHGSEEIVKYLLDSGANVEEDILEHIVYKPWEDKMNIVDLLIQYGAVITPPCMFNTGWNSLSGLKMLVDRIPPDQRDELLTQALFGSLTNDSGESNREYILTLDFSLCFVPNEKNLWSILMTRMKGIKFMVRHFDIFSGPEIGRTLLRLELDRYKNHDYRFGEFNFEVFDYLLDLGFRFNDNLKTSKVHGNEVNYQCPSPIKFKRVSA